MLIVYYLPEPDPTHLKLHLYLMDLRKGEAMKGTRFPAHPHGLLNTKRAGVRLTPLDHKILLSLMMHQSGEATLFRLNGRSATTLLERLSQTGRAYTWAVPSRPLRLLDSTLPAKPVWSPTGDAFKSTFHLPEGHAFLPAKPPAAVREEDAAILPLDSGLPEDAAWSWLAVPPLDDQESLALCERLASRFPGALLPPPPTLDLVRDDHYQPTPAIRTRKQTTRNGPTLLLEPHFLYGDTEISPEADTPRIRFFRDGTLIDAARNSQTESAALQRLSDAGFIPVDLQTNSLFDHAASRRCLGLDPSAKHTWTDILADLLPALEHDGWRITHDPDARPVRPDEDDWYADYDDSRRGWLSFERGVTADGQRVNLLPAIQHFLQHHRDKTPEQIQDHLANRDVPVPGPKCVVLIPGPRFAAMIRQLHELFGKGALDDNDRLRISTFRAAQLSEDLPGAWSPPPELLDLLHALRGALDVSPLAPPDSFRGELRPYQQHGLGWLDFLHNARLGGILADDMGLGKTVQLAAALLRWRLQDPDAPPALIVCPTSVLPNWRRELARFAPELNLAIIHGPDRHQNPNRLENAHVLLTTFPLLWRDTALYKGLTLSVAVLDEAQAIKNPRSKVHKTACKLNAHVRFALTGTPCENHLGDLWSLLHFIQPGFLGSHKDFRAAYRRPIEEDDCRPLRRALQNRVRPLLLRRTKELVAPELPQKTEIIQSIPLSDAQTDLYQTVRLAMTEKVQAEMQARGLARSRIVVLDALLKLRQICCDPRLRDPNADYTLPRDSAKLAYLCETLPELIEEGRKILLFSQFTSMLDLIRPELDRLRIPFVEIRGDTRDRDSPVEHFQNGDVPLLLISLKAGGTGLNLTAADTVIHYDPWWNPAVEAQATDRAHRIGQDKPVFVYKLVTEGGIEQTILDLQRSKKGLADIIEVDGERAISFTEADLNHLLAPLSS